MRKFGAVLKKKRNGMEALLLAALLLAVPAVRFGFFYDLNDDVLIKDILSGVYTGTPDGHTMQLLYPLGAAISLLYRLLSIPVFGVFLLLCQYASIALLVYRLLSFCRSWQERLLALGVSGAFFAAAFGRHLVFLQYTVTAGMLAAAAIFWFLTTEEADERDGTRQESGQAGQGSRVGRFVRQNIPALAAYWLAFCLRSEMALLLLPLAGVAGLCRWGRELRIFARETAAKYLAVFGILVLGMAMLLGLDSLAYAGEDWKEFRRFFAERTELYDYQFDFVMEYEENAAAYEAAGVSKARQTLLANYNFGVDDTIDEELLGKLREQAAGRKQAGGLFAVSPSEAFWSLRHRWAGQQDRPLNAVLLLCSAALLAAAFGRKNRRLLWQVPLCLATGGALWMFLLLRNRPLDRVLHPLYLGQIVLFAGLLLTACQGGGRDRQPAGSRDRQAAGSRADVQPTAGRQTDVQPAAGSRADAQAVGSRQPGSGWLRAVGTGTAVLVLLVSAARLAGTDAQLQEETAQRRAVNAAQASVYAYCRENPRMLYLEDVYSTVAYSEAITVDRDKPFNYDLLGGWLVKSPLTKEKLSAFGFETMGEAVLSGKGVQLLTETGTDLQWLATYFAERQAEAGIVKIGTIAARTDIYQVVPKSAQQLTE